MTRLEQRLERDMSVIGVVRRFVSERKTYRRFRDVGRRVADAEGHSARALLAMTNPRLRDLLLVNDDAQGAIEEITGLKFSAAEVRAWRTWSDVSRSIRGAFGQQRRVQASH